MSDNVLVTETVFPDLEPERSVFEETGIDLIVTEASSAEEIIDAAEGRSIDALLTATNILITEEVFERIDTLTMVSSYGIGVDHIDIEAATDHGVTVTNVPDYSVEEVSTHAVSLLLASVRRIPQYREHVNSGGWEWEVEAPLERLRGKTLGLVAFGKIPRRVSEKVDGFDLTVITYDPHVPDDTVEEYGVESVGFEELFARSDLISSHPPLTEETHHLIDADTFGAMKESAIYINTSRGPVVDESALYEAITENEIRGAAIDVMEEEPPDDSPLLGLDDVIITPHAAWYSEQSREELQRKAAEEVVAVLQNGTPRYVVNDSQTESWASTD
ncbi:MAG: C-terminal binding protein [Halovenus sp.]